MPLTGWLIKIKYLFLIILEAGKSEVVTTTDLVSGELPVLIDSCLLTITSQDEGVKEFSPVSFIRALIPFMRVLPS